MTLLQSASQQVNPLAHRRVFGYGTGTGGGASFVGVLDDYATGLWDAWGFARLLSSHTGALAQVRESDGGTAEDIGFDASTGLLDTSALAAHVGVNSGYAAALYGQANARPMLQATTGSQPRIVNAGTNVTIGGASAVCMETVAADTQRMQTANVTAYTGTACTMMVVHQAPGAFPSAMGRGALNLLDASNRSDVADTLACFLGNGSNGITLQKGDAVSNLPGDAVTDKIRVIFGVFDGVNKMLYDSYDNPSAQSNAETTAFNFDRVGMWTYVNGSGWSVAGEKWAAGAVWTRALDGAEVAALMTALKTLFTITVP